MLGPDRFGSITAICQTWSCNSCSNTYIYLSFFIFHMLSHTHSFFEQKQNCRFRSRDKRHFYCYIMHINFHLSYHSCTYYNSYSHVVLTSSSTENLVNILMLLDDWTHSSFSMFLCIESSYLRRSLTIRCNVRKLDYYSHVYIIFISSLTAW